MKSRFLVLIVLALTASFNIMCEESDPVQSDQSANNPPNQPQNNPGAGSPVSGADNVSTTPTLAWSCSDPDGDVLTYDVAFGTTNSPDIISTAQSADYYPLATLGFETTYWWKITARDEGGLTATSPTYFFTTIDAPVEVVSVPSAPSGPSSGGIGSSLTFTCGFAYSNAGHSIEYRFDWGNGSFSSWSSSTSASTFWSANGNYDVKAQARCSIHTSIESEWSDPLTVLISEEI